MCSYLMGDPCESVIQHQKGITAHRLRTTAVDIGVQGTYYKVLLR